LLQAVAHRVIFILVVGRDLLIAYCPARLQVRGADVARVESYWAVVTFLFLITNRLVVSINIP
jgi:hypothetical protein